MLGAARYAGALYAVYLPASSVAQEALGKSLNGFIFSNVPLVDDLVSACDKGILQEFRQRYAVRGIDLEMQTILNEKVSVLHD